MDFESFPATATSPITRLIEAFTQTPDLIALADVAERLNVSDHVLRNLIEKGDIDAVRIGGTWRIDPASVSAYLRNNRNGGRS